MCITVNNISVMQIVSEAIIRLRSERQTWCPPVCKHAHLGDFDLDSKLSNAFGGTRFVGVFAQRSRLWALSWKFAQITNVSEMADCERALKDFLLTNSFHV